MSSDHARRLARNLADLLIVYEEELMAIEPQAPAIGALRRAVGITIAEAHYWISDQMVPAEEWPHAGDDRTRQTNS